MTRYPRVGLAAIALLAVLLFALTGCARGSGVDWKIEVTGAVDKQATVSYDDLVGMKQTKLDNVLMRKSRGEDQTNSWEGASVKDVLAKAGAKSSATGITAFAQDGYAIQIPMADLGNAIIALKSDGKSINDEGKGAVRLIVPDKPANFWILGLTKIKVEDTPIVAPTPKPDNTPAAPGK